MIRNRMSICEYQGVEENIFSLYQMCAVRMMDIPISDAENDTEREISMHNLG